MSRVASGYIHIPQPGWMTRKHFPIGPDDAKVIAKLTADVPVDVRPNDQFPDWKPVKVKFAK